MADLIVVKAKLKDVVPGFNISSELAEALDAKARQLLKDAAARAEGNGRKTIMAKDL
jgi:histone H3/H4